MYFIRSNEKGDFCDGIPNLILAKFDSVGKVFSDETIYLYIGQSITRIACGGHVLFDQNKKRIFHTRHHSGKLGQ